MKKISAFLAVFLLSGCLSGNESVKSEDLTVFNGNYFEISYPKSWDIISKEELQSKAPSSTVLVLRSNEQHKGMFPNINIAEDKISENLSDLEFAKINIEKAPFIIHNLQSVQKEEIDLNGEKTMIFKFLGRTDEKERDQEYYQVFFTNSAKGVTITSVCSPDADASIKSLLENSIKSFKFKK